MKVRAVALAEAAHATPFHAANAAGTFSYHAGTWALRNEFVGEDWVEDRADGIETIRSDERKTKIAFCNVDLAGDDSHVPKPRSRKGSGAARASGDLFPDLPRFAPRPVGEWALYYLMIDENGATELTRPTIKGGTFAAAVERIHICGSDEGDVDAISDNGQGGGSDDIADNFDPEVARK